MASQGASITAHSVFVLDDEPERLGTGVEQVALEYAGTVYRFEGLSASQRTAAVARFSALQTQGAATADIVIRVFQAQRSSFQPRPTRAWEYELAISYSPEAIRLSGNEFTATIDRKTLCAELVTSNEGKNFLDPLENLFRVLVVYKLLEAGALVMHSAALTDERQGFLLFGRSGAGKTTCCELAEPLGVRVLSDELNAIFPTAEGVELRPMPFAGDFGEASITSEPSPLTGIYALEQAQVTQTRGCGRAEATARMIAACPYANADPYIGDSLVDRIASLQQRHPLRLLRFQKSLDFWGCLQDDHRA